MKLYQDNRDIVLEYLLKQDIVTGNASADQKPDLTITEIKQAYTEIESRFPAWVIFSSHIGGISCYIPKSYASDISGFLSKGGFTKEEYAKPVTYDEKLNLLTIIESSGDNDIWVQFGTMHDIQENPRVLKIVNALFDEDYLDKGKGNKQWDKFVITRLGEKSARRGELLTNNQNQGIFIAENHGLIARDQATINQNNFGDNAKVKNSQIGSANRQELSDKKPWWREATIQVTVGLIVVFIAWFFGCNR